MAEDSDLEKTEQASQQRLDKAREEGDVPRSRELATFVGLLASGGGVWFMGSSLVHALEASLASGMQFERADAVDFSMLFGHLSHGLVQVALAFAPLAGLLLLVGVVTPALIGGWVISPNVMQFDVNRINPVEGIAKMFTVRTLVELAKAIIKAGLVGIVAWTMIMHEKEALLSLGVEPLRAAVADSGQLIWKAYLAMTMALGVVALIDVPYQLWNYADRHKMTRQELRQEARESEGDPQVRGRIRAQQREMARRRMMANVPKADVVVTNPTHYAVALQYSDQGSRAPMVVAKGAGEVAARIRELADEHGVPRMEAPALARALYRHVELEREIPDVLYAAVAEVLAYVYQLRSWRIRGGQYPVMPSYIEVPPGMDPLESETEPAAAAEGDDA